MPRPAGRSADRSGSTRKPAPKTDAQIVRALRDTATGGKPPTVYAVKQTYGIGSSRAERLLAELGERTPAGSPATNGSGRKEGTP